MRTFTLVLTNLHGVRFKERTFFSNMEFNYVVCSLISGTLNHAFS